MWSDSRSREAMTFIRPVYQMIDEQVAGLPGHTGAGDLKFVNIWETIFDCDANQSGGN
jgi:hypothetical protein